MSGFLSFISVPHITSSSSNNTMPPSLFGSLTGWLVVLIPLLRSLISVSSDNDASASRSNTAGDPPSRLSGVDFISPLHNIYGFLTGLMLALTTLKYQGSSTNPFREHPTVMTLFLVAIFVYFIALLTFTRPNHMSDYFCMLMVGVCHISGALSCELLLLVLVSPMRSLLINVSSLALIVMLVLCYKCAIYHLHGEGTEEQGSEIADLEATTISTAQ